TGSQTRDAKPRLSSAGPANYHPGAVGSKVAGMPAVDLWAPVSFDGLPLALLDAAARTDWEAVRAELRTVMDAVTTDGAYGRALLQFVMTTDLPTDHVLDRYRASICIDYGDWDGLQRHMAADPIEAAELIGIRNIILAPTDRTDPPPSAAEHQRMLFEIYEWEFQRAVRHYKRWAHRMLAFYPEVIWTRRDIPAGRHLRFRRLQDAVWLAVAESHGGVLSVAEACADEAQRLGDEGEPGRDIAHDLKILVDYARGGRLEETLRFRERVASPAGLSPLGSWETLFHLVPFFTFLNDGSLDWTARWLHRLLETTGWRRPILVPPTVAADAALGLAAAGRRGVSIVELAALGGRANVTVEVAMRHIDDAEAPGIARLAAVEALGKLGTTHAREILHRLSRRTDGIGSAARHILATRSAGTTLTEREL